jgi:hypothetical protein
MKMHTESNIRSAKLLFLAVLVAFVVTPLDAAQQGPATSSAVKITRYGSNNAANPVRVSRLAPLGEPRTQSQGMKLHYLAHRWGKMLDQKKSARPRTAIRRLATPPAVTGLPIIVANSAFSGFEAVTVKQGGEATGSDFEPPDQGLCTDGSFVMEAVNTVLAVYDANTHAQLVPPFSFNDFFLTSDTLSDPRCYFDPPTRRWFLSLTDFQGYVDGTSSNFVLLAVSVSSDPTDGYNLYAIDTTNDGTILGGSKYFCDQPLLGADANGLYVSCNVYALYGSDTNFSNVNLYALSKLSLALGLPVAGVRFALSPPGLGEPVPFSVQPATSPDGLGARPNNGTEYFVSSYDIESDPNSKISVWALSKTDYLFSNPDVVALSYKPVASEVYFIPVDATQRSGPIPLGSSLGEPEKLLSTNDQRMQQVVWADGLLWASLTTTVMQGSTPLAGIAWFSVLPTWSGTQLGATMSSQGYVAALDHNIFYPSIGISPAGNGAIAFTISGPKLWPGMAFFAFKSGKPSEAYIRVGHQGPIPEDGFTCYATFGYGPSCRWGDYSAAVALPDGSAVWLAAETTSPDRDKYANWSTFIGKLALPH